MEEYMPISEEWLPLRKEKSELPIIIILQSGKKQSKKKQPLVI